MKKSEQLKRFWRCLADSVRSTLLLDYDGTLAPFVVSRDQAVPYPRVRELLQDIRRSTQTRLVIISGRAIDDLLPLLALDPPPEIWGCHGWEKLDAEGRRFSVELPSLAKSGLEIARNQLQESGLQDRCELKPASVALHWRGLQPQEADRLRQLGTHLWQALAAEHALEIHRFNGGLELRCPGRDKGTAISTILSESAPGEAVAFLGDDLTDEDGFRVLRGHGLGVLVRGEKRETLADVQITPPEELIDFLMTWRDTAPASQHHERSAES